MKLRFLESKYTPLVLISLLYIVLFICVKGLSRDELNFFYPKAHDGTSLFDFLKERYSLWTSRLIIEGVLIYILRLPFFIWKVTSGLCMAALLWSIYYLFFQNERPIVIWLFSVFFVLCNIPSLSYTAGWVATTLNYLWPITAFFICLIPIKMIENENKKNRSWYFLFLPFVLFAANQEILCIILLVVYLVFIIKSFMNSKHEAYYYAVFVLSLVSLIFIITCPGNTSRFASEVHSWYPQYMDLSFIQRILIGIMVIFNYIIIHNFPLFIIASLLFFLIIFSNEREKLFYRVISVIPFFSSLFILLFTFISRIVFMITKIIPETVSKRSVQVLKELIGKFFVNNHFAGLELGDKYHSAWHFMSFLIISIVLLSFLGCIFIIFKKSKEFLLLFFILALGFLSQLVVSFSPTIYESGIRTAILLFIVLVIIATSLFSKYTEMRDVKQSSYIGINMIFVFCAMFSIVYQFIRVRF